jgi:hypothetical protein
VGDRALHLAATLALALLVFGVGWLALDFVARLRW